MALCITEFLHDNPSSWSAWHELSCSTVWTSPHPEFILSSQTHPVDLPVALHRLLDDSTSSSMVEGMAADRHSHEVSLQEHGDQHAAGDQPRHGPEELAVGNSATAGFNEGPSQLRTATTTSASGTAMLRAVTPIAWNAEQNGFGARTSSCGWTSSKQRR